MGIYDIITIDDPRIPFGVGSEFQAYVEIADSYGDFYRLAPDGYLYRLTTNACLSRRYPHIPVRLDDYTDPALSVLGHYDDNQGRHTIFGYTLIFERGRLIDWRWDDELIPPI